MNNTAWRIVSAWSPVTGVLTRNGAAGQPDTTVSLNPELGGAEIGIDAQHWVLAPTNRGARGDVNCDGQVNVADMVALLDYLVGTRRGVSSCPLGEGDAEAHLPAADLDASGTTTLLDALLLARELN